MIVMSDPFPYVYAGGMFSAGLLSGVLAEFPGHEHPGWKRFGNDREVKAEGGSKMWGPTTKRYLGVLEEMAPQFGEAFGIPDLTLEMTGGGYHLIPPGGLLAVHTDFNRSPVTGLYRRLNVLTYLNRHDPGGHLELWDEERCVVDISPMFGWTVAFETSDRSWHGHPSPTTDWRRSIAGYFFSPEPPPGYRADHSTVWHA